MKRYAWMAVCLLLPQLALAAPTCMQRSNELLAALKAHDYTAARRHFDDKLGTVVTADRLQAVWQQLLPLSHGPYLPDAAGQTAHADKDGAISTPLKFTNTWIHMRVTCDASSAINGFRFLPGKSGDKGLGKNTPKAASGAWGRSTPTTVPSPWGPLPALLTVPKGKGPFPAVVMVAGSGPQDFDETLGPNKPFRDIARGLAAHGVASLRFDKRTYAFPQRAEGDMQMTVDAEVTDDAVVALHRLAAMPGIDPHRVFVLGHSLGAMMAPRIGQRAPHAAGLVMLAAPTRSLLEEIAEQVRGMGTRMGMDAGQVAAREKAIRAERRLLAAADASHPPAGKFMGAPQSYWMSLKAYDQVAVARSLAMPMLFLQGSRDFQVSPVRDFGQWKTLFAHDPRVTLREYPGLSHLFMPAGKTHSIQDYLKPSHVRPQVISDIAAWIKRQPPGKAPIQAAQR